MSQKISIIVADDHPVFRQGLAEALKRMKPISKVTMVSDGEEVISLLHHQLYDLVLMDIGMTQMNGLGATRIISENFPSVKVIALSMHDEAHWIIEMFKNGAMGYLLKNADVEEIEMAVTTVHNGGRYFTKDIAHVLLNHLGKPEPAHESHEPSNFHKQRIREIMFLIAHELTSVEIGNAISLAPRTIDDYRKEILSLTKSRNTAGITKYVLVNKIDQDHELKNKFRKVLEAKENPL